MPIKLRLITLFFIFISYTASAGLIEADIFGDGTDKGFTLNDSGYSIEWMDLDIAPQIIGATPNEIKGMVQNNFYPGWRMPTESEVFYLWTELFLAPTSSGYTNDPNITPSWFRTFDNKEAGNELYDVILSSHQIMGTSFNAIDGWQMANGFFEGDDGRFIRAFSYVQTREIFLQLTFAQAKIQPGDFGDEPIDAENSFFLVKDVTEVPEPTSLAIFILGFFVVIAKKLKIKN